MKPLSILLLLASIPILALPQSRERIQIEVGHGPEDMVLDTIVGERLLISCAQRRKGNDELNGIWEYDFESQNTRQLELILKSERSINFHGISISNVEKQGYLFVINHISKKSHEVIRFRITKDTLYEEKSYRHKLLKSPNDLYAIGRDKFYYSNDNMLGGTLGLYNVGTYGFVAKGLSYANGVHVINDVIYLSTTTGNKIYSFTPDWKNHYIKKDKLFKIKGGDNFTLTERNTLLVTSHPRIIKFIKHAANFEKKSPSMVYELDLDDQSTTVIYHDRTGNEISACSTALEYKGYLYLAQVFDPFILRLSLKL